MVSFLHNVLELVLNETFFVKEFSLVFGLINFYTNSWEKIITISLFIPVKLSLIFQICCIVHYVIDFKNYF